MEWLLLVLGLAVGVGIGLAVRRYLAASRIQSAESRAQRVVSEAEHEAETKVRAALVEVKEEIASMRREAEEDVRLRRDEVVKQEDRRTRREDQVDSKQKEVERKEEDLGKLEANLERIRGDLEKVAERHRRELETVARMTALEAREALQTQVIDEAKRAAMGTVREIEQRAREEAEARARKIVTIAIQRVASEQTAESTVSVLPLPSDDMKGRISGREGRNIRAFEALTGVNLIIDDTPEAVVLSCFDPVRRETARLTLEKLVSDGRIHPARIEEMYDRSSREVEDEISRAGEAALADVGIADVHPEMIKLLGGPPREPRDVREASGEAGGELHLLARGGEDLRHAGRPRGPGHGQAHGGGRPGVPGTGARHRQTGGGGAPVSRPDQDHGGPRDQGRGVRQIREPAARACTAEIGRNPRSDCPFRPLPVP